ncbi:response regulator [Sulfurovum sp.]|uniref:response regulator n=1 Tax=Sulfurovum sp. TaxID=1969726 RepID=UPI002867B438|nr:response regulator [Sulfurovum sp.]
MYKQLHVKKFISIANILYLTDNENDNMTLSKFEKYFSNIYTVQNEEEVTAELQTYYQKNGKYYDIIVIDTDAIHFNCIDLCNTILSQNKEQNIIIILKKRDDDISKFIQLGIFHFITKPADNNTIESNILQIASILHKQEIIQNQHIEIQTLKYDLESAKKSSEEASHQKSYFLANMSHEIRTPLNAIMGFITLLHKKETNQEKLKYLKILKTSSDTLLQVINDILDITKIESGKLEIDKIPFNPYEKLMDTIELFQVIAAKKGVKLTVKTNQSLPATLIGDPFRIKQIFSNLLSNAIKFTPSGSNVKCVIWYKKNTLHIKVKDYGIGIIEEKHKYIFEAFHQADNIMATEYGGTGLGLALSSELTKLLHGSLNYKNNKAGGSIFTLSMKLQSSDTKPLDDESQKIDSSNIKLKGHILIVEDIEANQIFLSIVLDNLNLTYDTAENGIEAIEKCKKNTYDLILMDENMPQLRGSQAAKEIKKSEKRLHKKSTPIISLTANALKGDKERFLDAGMDDYLSKPVEPTTLITILAKYLKRF